jgi:hypothetical protein
MLAGERGHPGRSRARRQNGGSDGSERPGDTLRAALERNKFGGTPFLQSASGVSYPYGIVGERAAPQERQWLSSSP